VTDLRILNTYPDLKAFFSQTLKKPRPPAIHWSLDG
jgi:hypothetical protein